MLKDFLSGTGYFIKGVRLAGRPELRRFILVPLLINIIVFSAAIWTGAVYFESMVNWLLPEGSTWWHESLRTLIWILFGVITLLLMFFTFTMAANIIGAPFNGLLSEKVEEMLSGERPGDDAGVRHFLATIIPAVLNEFRKLFYFIFTAAVLFLILLIPGINIISPLAWAVFTSWMLALEYIAYPMENHDIFFSRARKELKRGKSSALGFGLCVMAATAVPLVNFLVMPAAVAGATAMWVDRLRD